MLDHLGLILRWFLDDVRGKFPDSPTLFADETYRRAVTTTLGELTGEDPTT
ncbi:hypothetical protein ACFWAR_00920 [Streptomyces sp. NPDC059917]|uniref:hypothetical protein n=1 Tax=Streptomyces sp. NPDC059917 TaxID=3347002 RepID=UPI0036657691